jgi:hypothetical protein
MTPVHAMFVGHFAVAFGAKRAAPAVSLGTLFIAGQLADLIWPVLVIAGVEQVAVQPGLTVVTPLDFSYYPFSHSLVADAAWALLLGAAYIRLRRAPAWSGFLLACVVLSHWVLDALSHRADVPLTIGAASARVGLGLWNSFWGTIAVELTLFGTGVWLYAKTTRAVDRTGRLALWGLVAFLHAIYVANLFGPPPPSGMAAAWSALAMWLLVAWGYWVDRHRTLVRT